MHVKTQSDRRFLLQPFPKWISTFSGGMLQSRLKNLSCRVVWWSWWQRMERGCGRASHKASKGGLMPPPSSKCEATSPWLASVWLLLVKVAAQSSPGGITAVLVCQLLPAVCLLGSSVFHGREDRRAACGLWIVLGYSLTLLSLPFTAVSN